MNIELLKKNVLSFKKCPDCFKDEFLENLAYHNDIKILIPKLTPNIIDEYINLIQNKYNLKWCKEEIINFYNLHQKLIIFILDNYKFNISEQLIEENRIYNFRINQIDAIEKLEKDGLQTGIHCQATGCGKTNIILKYIEYTGKQYINAHIILFTERKSIFTDLFDCNLDKINFEIIEQFKKDGICDITNFKFINRITNKKNDYDSILINSQNPTILIINRSFLTRKHLYKKFNKDNIHLILHDECHNTSSIQCNLFLSHCYEMDIPIVGFSATPIRTGKNDIQKLLDIYGIRNEQSEEKEKINLITDYNMVYAIQKGLILAPEFYWYYITDSEIESDKIEIKEEEINAVLELLNNLVLTVPYKKIIAWCKTIKKTKKWLDIFKKEHKKYNNLVNFTYGLDTSSVRNERTGDNNFYDKFKNILGSSILFCAEKHREGSDILNLDMCIFLDNVKKRGAIPFIQSIGRVLRKSQDNRKQKGIIIDGIIKVDMNEMEIIDKILNYYSALQNISIDNNEYMRFNELKNAIQFDRINENIILNINNLELKINCKKLDFSDIVSKFNDAIEQKIKLEKESILTNELQDLKDLIKDKFKSDIEYKEYAKKNNLEINPEIKYINVGWINYYDFLNIDITQYPDNLYDFKDFCNKNEITQSNYLEKIEEFNLPLMVKELYGFDI
jgi:hypothetical protein